MELDSPLMLDHDEGTPVVVVAAPTIPIVSLHEGDSDHDGLGDLGADEDVEQHEEAVRLKPAGDPGCPTAHRKDVDIVCAPLTDIYPLRAGHHLGLLGHLAGLAVT